MDVFTNVEVPINSGETKLLFIMYEVIVFVNGKPTREYASEAVDRSHYHNLFVSKGIPRLVIVNSSSAFNGVVPVICKLLFVTWTLVYPENHRAI